MYTGASVFSFHTLLKPNSKAPRTLLQGMR